MSDTGTIETIFTSVCRHGVDEKRRIQCPAGWRAPLVEKELMLMMWSTEAYREECVLVLPPAVARKFVERATVGSFTDPEIEAARWSAGERAVMVHCDKSGRITLPDWMAKEAAIGKEATLLGMLDRFQIWNPERFEAVRQKMQALAPGAYRKHL
jgi:MraZ protein